MSRERTTTTTTMRNSMLVAAMALAAALMAGLLYYAAPGMAAASSGTTMVVNTKQDEANADGDCSLREAIQAANTNAAVDACAAGSSTEEDAIRFSLGKKATITLHSALPSITDGAGLDINGRKAKITISGNDSVRVLRVDPGAKLTLIKLKVTKGRADFGAGILNEGSTLTVRNSTISGNSAQLGGDISRGGGIYNEFGTLTVTNSTISGNSALESGGIYNHDGTLTVTNSTLSGNSAQYGGGIINHDGTLTVTNSTLSGNSATGEGGGIFNGGTLTVTNSTISGNSATREGGGIFNGDPLTVTNSTISGNSAQYGGGIYNSDFATATFNNTIVANSPSGGNCFNHEGTLTDGGYNIEDGTSCSFSEENNSLSSTNPKLKALDNYGGPTKTHALKGGSPAINLIPNGENGCGTEIKKDQRGVKRPQGNKCDTGSFEKEL